MTNRTLSLETLDGTSIRDFLPTFTVCIFTEKLDFYIYIRHGTYMALLEMYKELGYSIEYWSRHLALICCRAMRKEKLIMHKSIKLFELNTFTYA